MDITTLHQELLEAYAVPNLNRISLTLINLYKNEQYGILQRIADIIADFIRIEIGENGKGFYRFMMLYHPDRSKVHISEINQLAREQNFNGLLEYSHILKLERIDEIAGALDSYEDIDYSPVYEWDVDLAGFRIVTGDERDDKEPSFTRKRKKRLSFYDAVKVREYGHTNIEFPSYYLEDWEEFELSASDINDLDGIQYCIHTKNFDLSENYIYDLTLLASLTAIEELNLAENEIRYIDALGCLKNLRSVTLCNNRINEITPLFGLEKLEYADLSGNQINPEELKRLKELGVTVIV
jgi:Leucine-rich repeat (LRR) protein